MILPDGITSAARASDDLALFMLDLSGVTDGDAIAIQPGLPAVNPGWEYRTFPCPGTVSADPAKFIGVV